MRHRRLCQQLERDVVVDAAIAQHAAMAVRGVLAQAHVGDQHQLGHGKPNGAQRHLHDALVVVGRGCRLVLVIRQPEQDHGRYAGRMHVRGLLDQRLDRVMELPLQRLDRGGWAASGPYEQRLHEI